MKSLKRFYFLLIFCLILVSLFEVRNVYALSIKEKEEKIYSNVSIDENFATDRIIVVLNQEASFKNKIYSKYDFMDIDCKNVVNLTEYDTNFIADKICNGFSKNDISKIKTDMTDYSNFHTVLSLEVDNKSKENLLNYIDIIMKRDDVLYAGPDYYLLCTDINYEENYADNSEIYEKINLPETWKFTTGSSDILVGVLDSGIDGNHPDLENSIVHDLCKDFISENVNNNVNSSLTDTFGHGTHVAGIIGAAYNDEVGINGVCLNVGLVSLKISTNGSDAKTSYVLNAINYAKENNIHILNLSYTWSSSLQNLYDVSLESVIASYNGLMVCSSGNDSRDITNANDLFPTCYEIRDNLISVGATDINDSKPDFSNYGTNNVDIYAPGVAVNSTYPMDLITNWYDGSGYRVVSGTSMAAPFVSGAAALLLSIKPDLTSIQLKEILIESADLIEFMVPNPNVNSLQGFVQKEIPHSAKRLNIQSAIKYLFDNYCISSYEICENPININEILDTSHQGFSNNNKIFKINTYSIYEYIFEISAYNILNIEIFDMCLDKIEIDIDFSNDNLSAKFILNGYYDYYYIRITSSVSNASIPIYINIHKHSFANHFFCAICNEYVLEHEYTHSYTWKNNVSHYSKCGCGEMILQPHIVSSNSINSSGYSKCLLCKGNVQVGFIGINSLLKNVIYRTNNGSFILANGVIVLVDEDIEDYFLDKLVFAKVGNELL